MGMSASQARYLSLVARQSDLEYQGQQINNERTILSQQVTDLYSQLQNLEVPTPPSTTDYSTVIYTGTDGASTFTLSNIVPTGDTYNVDLNYTKTGHYLSEAGSAKVTQGTKDKLYFETVDSSSFSTSQISGAGLSVDSATKIANDSTKQSDNTKIMHNVGKDPSGNDSYYVKVGNNFVLVTSSNQSQYKDQDKFQLINAETKETTNDDGTTTTDKNYGAGDYVVTNPVNTAAVNGTSLSDIQNSGFYIVKQGGTTPISTASITANNVSTYFNGSDSTGYTLKSNFLLLEESTSATGTAYSNPNSSDYNYQVAGNDVMTLSDAISAGYIAEDSKENYIQAMVDTFPDLVTKDSEGNVDTSDLESKVMVYFETSSSGKSVPHFVLAESLNSLTDVTGSKQAVTYDYTANGSYTDAVSKEDCKLTFDTSGRITSIDIPTKYDDDGNPTSYKTVSLTASQSYDENAYADAYNQYEYDKYLYDKQQAEINAKTEVIQQEDKKLELKLQRLDNERTQITTEVEALDKVINDNIDASYKTFSG
jgi:hypothetical protein